MADYLIACRSMTYAQRAERALRRSGITASVIKVKSGLNKEGCVYAVKTGERVLRQALALLRERDLHPQSLYRVLSNGGYQEVSL